VGPQPPAGHPVSLLALVASHLVEPGGQLRPQRPSDTGSGEDVAPREPVERVPVVDGVRRLEAQQRRAGGGHRRAPATLAVPWAMRPAAAMTRSAVAASITEIRRWSGRPNRARWRTAKPSAAKALTTFSAAPGPAARNRTK